jgi:Type ISP C-terminal specificity domain/N-6 DNA Methylase
MIKAFKLYFDAVKELDLKDSTEHTLRTALENLLNSIAKAQNTGIKIIHEPKKDKSGKGAPDFKFKINESILGYLENKKIEENLDQILKSEQIAKYKKLSGNIILTNYLEWIWLRDGSILDRETLCYQNDVGNRRAKLDPEKAEKVGKLIDHFCSTPPKQIGRAKDLAPALATRCHDLRDVLLEELLRQEKEHQEERLWGLYEVFKKEVFHELEIKEFADAFAQTLGYGLFLARLNMQDTANQKLTLDNARKYVPTSFALIRELVNFLDELEKDQYLLAKQPVDEILSIMNTLDLRAIHEDLAFTKGQGKLLENMEEERLLFAKDPYVYFYEDFLKAYDKETKKKRGVYYTPPPVVNFIIRAVNDLLKDTFGISKGLAERRRVTVLDFATGTGTFLIEVLQQIFENVSEGIRDQVIQEHVLKNLYGFEYLIAPYTIAHLKLSQFLRDKGYELKPKERLQIYLTNTLEPISPQTNWLLPALSREVEQAQEIKDKPILVITGNPPYNVKSKNTGEWITNLLKKAYFTVDGKPLNERNPKNLLDDYVKFIRFAQWKMDRVDEGIVGIITNHSFLDNTTFPGMRQSLMKSFNQIYVLNLHGSVKEQETARNGSHDENVFDIEQGVAISLFIKKKGIEPKIVRGDLWGTRKAKYRTLLETDISTLEWEILTPDSPYYYFKSQDKALRDAYNEFQSITGIFANYSSGVKTSDDKLLIGFDSIGLSEKLKGSIDKFDAGKIKNFLYRSFDNRVIYYDTNLLGRARESLMKHMLDKENIGIIFTRQFVGNKFDHALISGSLVCHGTFYLGNKGQDYLAPLYLYNFYDDKKPRATLFAEADPFGGKERIENFTPAFRNFIDDKYGKHYEPEQILGYIYAILHSPTYRSKYVEALKTNFPRIPFIDDDKTFEKLSLFGWQLVQAHLLKEIPATLKVDINRGNMQVQKPEYDEKQQRLYISKDQYFSPVPQNVWEFYVGGYQVLDRYLKFRKGRKLTLDEIENVQNIVKVLAFTITQMQKIDEAWKP